MNHPHHFETISNALYWLVEHHHEQPSLKDMSKAFGISEFHLQKTFQDYAGISPKQFLKHLSKEEAILRLQQGQTVLDTSIDVGLSGPGRLHDLLVTTEAVTPGQVRSGSLAIEMEYGFSTTPFGDALVAWTSRGVSFLGFTRKLGRQESLNDLTGQWSQVKFSKNGNKANELLDTIFSGSNKNPIRVWLRGSPFQLKVWEALIKIPPTAHCTYGQIAAHLDNPKASRAVGTAIGRNPISWLIPCHRVITSMGTLGGYRWGLETKQAMLGLESSGQLNYPDSQFAI
jgi:AraC family transcriptional regulator of adaptative response/methylated-DNA-[protein]-cysteine methyltransferase